MPSLSPTHSLTMKWRNYFNTPSLLCYYRFLLLNRLVFSFNSSLHPPPDSAATTTPYATSTHARTASSGVPNTLSTRGTPCSMIVAPTAASSPSRCLVSHPRLLHSPFAPLLQVAALFRFFLKVFDTSACLRACLCLRCASCCQSCCALRQNH